jgi:MFS family permease
LWRNRDYLLLWSGEIISTTGSQVSQLAFPLLILALTHSAAQAGFAGALRTIPYLILSLPAGALADRWNRKLVMIICDLARFLCLASIPLAILLGHLTVIQLYVVSLLEGTFFVLFDLAEVSCLPQVVSKEQIATATAQNIATYNIASLIGSPLCGLLYSIGRFFPFLADAISYLCSVISLFFIKRSLQTERTQKKRPLLADIKEGLQWLWGHPLFRFLALILCGINLLSAGLPLLIIVIGQRLHTSSVNLGLVLSAAGIGGILGSLTVPWLRRRFSFFTLAVGALWMQALLLPLLILAPNMVMVSVIITTIFFFAPIFDITQRSQRISAIPDALQGRVNSIYRLIAFSGQPIGLALAGLLIQDAGTTPTIIVCTAIFIVVSTSVTINPHIRQASA